MLNEHVGSIDVNIGAWLRLDSKSAGSFGVTMGERERERERGREGGRCHDIMLE